MKKVLLLGLSLLMVTTMLWAQDRTVSGTVTSVDDGSTLPGVNVVVKGTTNGSVTDIDGNYKISVPEDGATLVFSFIGLESQEVEIGTRSVIDVQMASDVKQLSEVVVTALGFEDKRDNLGISVSKVEAEAIVNAGETGVINALAGKASSVQIIRSTGDPGAGSYIQIRGQSTLTGGTQPLIVIDGVPTFNSSLNAGSSTGGVSEQSRLNDLSSDDIASMQVLKGANAAALWGTRAANGVIVITTKKGSGQKGKVNINLRSTYSIDEINKNHPLQTTYGQGSSGYYSPTSAFSWGDKIAERSGGADVVDQTGTYFLGDQTGTKYYPVTGGSGLDSHGDKNDRTVYQEDNFAQIFDKGHYFENALNLSGGDGDGGTYFASISNLSQDGIMQGLSDYRRTTARFNFEKKMNKVVTVGANSQYTNSFSNRVQKGSNLAGLFLGALRTAPDFDISDYTGTQFSGPTDPAGTSGLHRSYRRYLGATNPVYNNPLWTLNKQRNESTVNRFLVNGKVQVDATEELSFIGRVGFDSYTDKRLTYFPKNSGAESAGWAGWDLISESQVNFDAMARYAHDFSESLTFNAVVGWNVNSRNRDWLWTNWSGFTLADDGYLNPNNGPQGNQDPGSSFRVIKSNALYTDINFGISESVFVNLAGRYEVASSFSKGFFFPAANVAWQFTQLSALSGNSILSFGKMRVGYGQVGVQPGAYQGLQYYSSAYPEDGGWGGALDPALFGSGTFRVDGTLGNENIEPEIKKEFEVGTDLRFWEDRVRLSYSYYSNKNENALFFADFAASTGFDSQYGNKGSLENKGHEIDFGFDLFSQGDFKWTVVANWSTNKNKVTNLFGTESIFLNGFTGSSSRIVEGQPIGVLWGGRWDRVDLDDNNSALILDENGFPQSASSEGILGDPNPAWRGGLGSNLSWKGVSLSFLFESFQGAEYWNGTRGVLNYFGRSAGTDVETTVSASEAATIVNYSGNDLATYYAGTPSENGDGSITFRGKLEDFGNGQVALDQAWYTSTGGGFGPVGEQFVDDASWTRLREVSVGYLLNSEGFRNATKLQSVSISLSGRNLWLKTNWEGIDPETNLTGVTTGRGLEYFSNPNTKSFMFTLKVNY